MNHTFYSHPVSSSSQNNAMSTATSIAVQDPIAPLPNAESQHLDISVPMTSNGHVTHYEQWAHGTIVQEKGVNNYGLVKYTNYPMNGHDVLTFINESPTKYTINQHVYFVPVYMGIGRNGGWIANICGDANYLQPRIIEYTEDIYDPTLHMEDVFYAVNQGKLSRPKKRHNGRKKRSF